MFCFAIFSYDREVASSRKFDKIMENVSIEEQKVLEKPEVIQSEQGTNPEQRAY